MRQVCKPTGVVGRRSGSRTASNVGDNGAFLYRSVLLLGAEGRRRAEHERRSAELIEEMRREAGRR